jgi:hypothetical protein
LFKSILDIKHDVLAKLRDKRRSPRYSVGPNFPLKATINLVGSCALGGSSGLGCDWTGRVVNISPNGIGMHIPPAAITVCGEKSVVTLTLENHTLAIPCTVSHLRVQGGHALCGVSLQFNDFTTQKGYLQLVETVRTGATLTSFEPKNPERNPSGMVREEYRAENKAVLTNWRDSQSKRLDSFELLLGEHRVKSAAEPPALEVSPRQKEGKSDKGAVSPSVIDEVRQLFRWVVPNLSKTIPDDLRKLMETTSGSTPAQPAGTGKPSRSTAPTDWGAPKPKTTPHFAPLTVSRSRSQSSSSAVK